MLYMFFFGIIFTFDLNMAKTSATINTAEKSNQTVFQTDPQNPVFFYKFLIFFLRMFF